MRQIDHTRRSRPLATVIITLFIGALVGVGYTSTAGAADDPVRAWASCSAAGNAFELPIDLTASADPASVTPGGSFDATVDPSVVLTEAWIQGALNTGYTIFETPITEVTVTNVRVRVPAPAGATGSLLEINWAPGAITVGTVNPSFDSSQPPSDTNKPSIATGAFTFSPSSAAVASYTATGAEGSDVDFLLGADPLRIDLKIGGVLPLPISCPSVATSIPDPAVDPQPDPPVTIPFTQTPFLSVPIVAEATTTTGSTSSTDSTTSSSTSSSSTSSSSTSSSTTSSTTSSSTTSSSTTSTTSTTDAPAFFVPAGTADLEFVCVGADAVTANILAALGGTELPVAVQFQSSAFESVDAGESFITEFTWKLTLSETLVASARAVDPENPALGFSNLKLTAGVTAGATGADVVGQPSSRTVALPASGGLSVTEGPFAGTFTRTGDIGDSISFAAKDMSLTATAGGIGLNLVCDPEPAASVISVVDEEGDVPATTTTTSTTAPTGSEVLGTTVAGEATLPRTGGAQVLSMVLAGLFAVDLGYLAVTASRPSRRRRLGDV